MKIQFVSLCAALGCAFLTLAEPAAAGGLAWDSVTKFSMGQSAPQPGDFAQDFQAASQPPSTPQPSQAGMFGLAGMMAKAQSVGAMFMNGFAERYFANGSLLRVENPGARTATITDCKARTRTTLDYANKTYQVESLDALAHGPSGGSSASSASSPRTMPDTMKKMDMVLTTSALGSKNFGGLSADGYQSDMKITITPENGESKTMDMVMTSYFAAMPEPAESCYHASSSAGMGPGALNVGLMQRVMSAMRTPNADSRFAVSSSGPPIPSDRFALFTVFAPQSSQGGVTIVMEKGNIRPISASEASLFSVPAGFTRQN
jgi:hypothetical protein